MAGLVKIFNDKMSWHRRVQILLRSGWFNSTNSILPSDHVFWSDGNSTMHYRASMLAAMPFTRFYRLVHDGDYSA